MVRGSRGRSLGSFVSNSAEANQQRLEDEQGLCIMYTHLGAGFYRSGRVDPGFERVMRRWPGGTGGSRRSATILDHLRATQGELGARRA